MLNKINVMILCIHLYQIKIANMKEFLKNLFSVNNKVYKDPELIKEIPKFNYLDLQDYSFEQRKAIYDIILKRNEGISITLTKTCNDPNYGFSHGLKNIYYSFKNKRWSLYTDNEIEIERIFKNKYGLKIDMNEFMEIYKR